MALRGDGLGCIGEKKKVAAPPIKPHPSWLCAVMRKLLLRPKIALGRPAAGQAGRRVPQGGRHGRRRAVLPKWNTLMECMGNLTGSLVRFSCGACDGFSCLGPLLWWTPGGRHAYDVASPNPFCPGDSKWNHFST